MSDKKPLPLPLANLISRLITCLERAPNSFIALFARVGIAGVFWKSAMTKITFDGDVSDSLVDQLMGVLSFKWTISENTFMLFQYEYNLPVISYHLAALMGTAVELTAPVLIVLGLASRAAAAALLVVVMTIQFLVYPAQWLDHSLWAAVILFILCRGPGVISLDYLCARLFLGRAPVAP